MLAVVAAIASRDRERRPAWRRANGAVVLGWLLDRAIMHRVGRDRPPTPLVTKAGKEDSPSFPSSHTTTAFAMARAYTPLLPRVPLYSIALTQATARLVANEHYPSDVLAGALLGWVAGHPGRR